MRTFYNLLRNLLLNSTKTQNETTNTTTKRMSFVSYLAVILLSVFGSMNMQGQTIFSQNFEGTWTLPTTLVPAWGGSTTLADQVWHKTGFTTGWTSATGAFSPLGANSTTASARFHTYDVASGLSGEFITPTIDLSTYTAGSVKLSFYHINTSGTDVLNVYVSTDNGVTWSSAISPSPIGVSASWTLKSMIAIPGNSATTKIKFTATSDYGTTDIGLDEVRVYLPIPADAAPTNFVSSLVTVSGTTIGWTDNSTNETAFRVYRSTDGLTYTQVGSDIVSTTSAGISTTYSSVQTGLLPGTTYYYRIAAVFEAESAFLTGTQATSTCPTFAATISIDGATAVPGTSYPTLSAAISDLKACGITQPTILELASGYVSTTETFPITLSSITGASAVNTITIREASGVTGKVITSNNTTATIDINVGNYWIIDGRSGGTGSTKDLSITNTSTATGGTAIRFINGGSNNVVKYTSLLSSFPSATSGVVVFSTGSNANNTIDNCSIDGNAGTTATPTLAANNGVYSSGTANDNNSITNCTIFNNWVNGAACVGVLVGTGSSGWTITGNSLYQTNIRTVTLSMASIFGIQITNTSGNGYTISNNKIGGTAANCGGSAFTVNLATGTFANKFIGINLSLGTTVSSSVQGNTIANHVFNTSSGTTAAPGIWCGIHLSAGNANIGTVTGNTIGSTTGVDSIIVSSTGNSTVYGINAAGTTYSISNNNVGAITTKSISSAMVVTVTNSVGIVGINTTAGTTVTINNNVIGSTTTANSLYSSIAYVGTTANTVNGIQNSSTATIAITNNTIANLNSAYVPTVAYTTSSVLRGIASSSGANTITGNTVRNLTTAALATGTTTAASVIGISYTSTTATAASTVSQNSVFDLSNSNATGASSITGIYYAGPTTLSNVVAKNKIYNLNLSTSSTSGDMRGLVFASGLATLQNNTIRLGYGVAGANIAAGFSITGLNEIGSTSTSAIYHNTVYVGGTGVSNAGTSTCAFKSDVITNTRSFQNNIFINARSNASAGSLTSKHYSVRLAGANTPPVAGLTSNYNIYSASGTGGVFGFFATLDVANLTAWKTATGQDNNSLSSDPCLAGPTTATPDLHLTSCSGGVGSPAEGAGILVASVTDDFEGQTRSNLSPVDIGADAGLYGPLGNEMAPQALVSPIANGCKTSTETVSVSIINNNAQTIDFSVNPVTVTVTGTGTVAYSSSVLLNTGTLVASATQLVPMPATIDMSVNGTYNLTATTSVASDLNTVNDALPITYNIASIGGSYNVGAGGNFATLEAAVAAYNAANCFTGNVVFNLTDATYNLGTITTPLTVNSNAVANAGSYSLTIKPAAGVSPTITGAIDTNTLILIKGNNIIVDGSNTGGTTRDLTITNTSTTSPNVVLVGSTGTTPVTGVTIKNATIINGANTGTAISIANTTSTAGYFNNITIQNNNIQKAYIGVYALATVATGNGSGLLITQNTMNTAGANSIRLMGVYVQGVDGATVSNNTISNIVNANAESPYGIRFATGTINSTISGNTVSNCSLTNTGAFAISGIYVSNSTTATTVTINNNTVSNLSNTGSTNAFGGIVTFSPTNITNNTVSGLSGAYGYGSTYGIISSGNTNAAISGNTITNISGTSSGSAYVYGMNMQGANSGLNIFNNTISAIKCNHTSLYYSYGMYLTSTAGLANNKVYNNVIYDIESYNYYAYGMYLNAGNGYSIDHNTINMNTSTASMVGYPYGLYISSSITTAGSVNVRNNIIGISSTANTSQYPVYSAAASTVFGTMNYNNYFSSNTNLGYIGSALTSLANMITGFGGNANSTNITPNFLSATDMHLNAGSNVTLDNLGTPIATVTSDFDGQTRSLTTPDMGADEFTTVYCTGQPAFAGAGSSSPVQQCTSGVFTLNANAPQAVGLSFQWEYSTNGTTWTPIANATSFQYITPTITATTNYHCLMTCAASGLTTTSDPITATIIPPPTIVITPSNGGYFCTGAVGTGMLTASGASNYTWSPVTNLFTDAAFTTAYVAGAYAPTVYSNTTTNITYTVTGTDAVTGCVNSTPIAVGPPVITLTSSVPNFCGTGGLVTLTASSPDSGMTYAWSSLTSGAVLDATTGSVVTSTIAATSDFKVIGTGTGTFTGCTSLAYSSIGVYPLPTAVVQTSANGLCPGGTATITSGLSAGNFTSAAIPFAPLTAPTSAVTLVTGGAAVVPQTTVSLDDGGWSGVPVGFNFNFFGTSYNTITVGTNGTLFFGTTPNVSDFTFVTLPSTTEPFNMIAVLAMDNNLATATGGTIKYWTTGYVPNRKFVVSYEAVHEYGDTQYSTAQAIFYETTGVVEVHVTSSTNIDRNKLIGINNGDGTIGALAYASGTVSSVAPQNPITTSFAYRFSPPSNYTTVWTANGSPLASGTNIFQQTVTPVAGTVTTYDIRYTNLTTGCQNAPGSAQVVMSVLGNTAPTGVTTSYTIGTTTNTGTICNGDTINLATSYPTTVGSYDGLVYQWQISYNGTTWTDIAGATYDAITNPTAPQTALLTYTPTAASQFRCKFVACSGVPSYSTPVSVDFTYHITASAGDTRCGTGVLNLTATGDGTAATNVKWYADNTSTVVLGTGNTFTTPSLNTTTTYYVGVKVGTCTSIRTAVVATVIPAPILTLNQTAIALCEGTPSNLVSILSDSTSYDTYAWSPTTGITGSASSGWIFNPAVTTTYTLTASQSPTQVGGQTCATTITLPVTVNVTPLVVTASLNTICENGFSVLSANPIVTGPQIAPTGYEASSAYYTGDEDIFNVTFGTLNNTSTCASSNSKYSDFTSLTAPTINTGTIVPISIQVGTCGSNYDNFTNVYIDYNRNGIFETDEHAYASTGFPYGPHTETGNIIIPATASPGITRMRVYTIEFGSETDLPVGIYSSWGETEDYNINIQSVIPYSETLTYAWSGPGLSATTGSSVTASPTTTSTYTVIATNPTTGCTNTTTTTVNVNEVPQITGPTELCMPNTITLSNAVAHGTWSTSNPDVATVSETGVVTGVGAGTVVISYAVSFSNPANCVITRTYTVTVHGPPTVVSYTQSQTILTNNNASFNVSATGSGLTYQWEESNGSSPLTFAPITNTGIYAGATSNTLSLTGVGLAYNGYLYHCVISGIGSCAAATSSAAVLNVGDTGIVSHPSNVSLCNTGNGTATYTVLGEGVVNGHAWQVNTGTGFANITDGTVAGLTYSGTTSATLTVTGITLTNSGWAYRCIISGPTNNPVSNPATLTVNQQLTFPATLAAQTVCYSGGTANYAVAPLGTATGYQWQYSTNGTTWNSVANGTPADATYFGATSNALTVNTTALTPVSGTYYYRAQAIAALPCADAYSNGARMYINNPTITTQAIDATVADGSSVNFTVVANATAPTYQWQTATSLNGTYANVVNDIPVGLTYIGDTTVSLNVNVAIATVASATNYYRTVVTSNGCSVASTGALLTITNYCASAASFSADEDITNVIFGTLSNATACSSLAGSQGTATGTASLYSNFRAVVAPPVLNAIGMIVPLSVQVTLCGTSNYAHEVSVYFDFNHNGSLTDAGEEFIIWNYLLSGTHTINANIAIPSDALMGTTIMRVVCKEDTAFGPCLVSDYGETEDYTVDLQQPLPCAGAPLAGTITSTVSNICYSGTAVLNLTGYTSDLSGISIRWEKSTDGANWIVIPGETSAQLTTTVSQETVFHAVVTCSNGNVSSTSDPYTISVDSPTIISVADATRCGTGTVTLSAVTENADSVKWYTSDTSVVPIATGNTFTTPIITSTTGYYVEAATINCTSVRAQVVAYVTPPPALGLGSTTATICESLTTPAVMVTIGDTDFNTFDWSPADTVSGNIATGYSFNPSVTTTYTLTASQTGGSLCANTATFTVIVNPRPSELTIAPSPAAVCVNTVQSLIATGGVVSQQVMNNTMDVLPSNFTASGGGATATLKTNYYAQGTGSVLFTTATTSANAKYAMNTNLDLSNSSAATLSFSHIAAMEGSGTSYDYGYVEYSIDGGTTWINFTPADYVGTASTTVFNTNARFSTKSYADWITQFSSSTATPGTSPATSLWKTETFNVPTSALSSSQFRIRFRYTTDFITNYYGWLIDDVKIDKVATATMAWTPTTNLYTNAAATTAYTGQNVATVYVKSSAAGQTTYTATATSSFGCIRTASVDVTVNPDTTIALGSGSATTSGCINTALTDIVYTLGHETAATVTGLPLGVTGTYASGIFTISGTPTESGTFPFTVTATGLCLPASLSGSITVNPDTTIALTGGGALQTLCVNNAITDVVYGITNGTGANVSGLPAGVVGNYVAGVFTISGTPTVSGTFPFTVTTTGLCVQQSLSGTITVKPDTTLTLTSGSDAQTLCVNNAIANIVYAVANGTATVTGLPTGVSGTYASGVVTISGIPTVSGTFTYTVSTSGLCVQTSATGTFTVNPTTTLALTSGSVTQTRCINNAISNIVYAVGNGTGANVTGLPTGVTGNYASGVFTISGTPTVSGTFAYTVTPTGLCVISSLSGTITVNANTAITTQPVSQVVCPRSSVTFVSVAIGVNLTYQWYFNGVAIANATSATYTIGFVNPSDAGIYTVVVSGGCSANVTSTQAFLAVQSVPAPTGTSVQTAVQGALLSSIVASGTNLTWYASVADAQAGINPLPLTYVLPVGTTTFYATQTVNGCQGYATLSVTMSVALGTKGFDLAALVYYPNPVTEMFNISYKLDIESVEVYNITGQRIMEVKPNMLETQIDMSALPTGTYMMLVKADGASKVIKVVKK